MERYIQQLLTDIKRAQENIPDPWWYFIDVDEDEEDAFLHGPDESLYAPSKNLEELTGLEKIQLPPDDRMNDAQVHRLLGALKEMLSAFNCHVVFQRAGVPERVQYRIIRSRFRQEVPQLRNTDNFFSFCDPSQNRSDCELGEYCECNFLDGILARYEDLENEAEEQDEFDFHDHYLRRKYGRDDWDHFHRYHDWDPLEDDFTDEEDPDDWWDEEEEDW